MSDPPVVVTVTPTGELETYREEARQAIFTLENIDEALRDAPTEPLI
jgi:hypothetical protein